jgi:hypothetical protein
LNVDTRRCVGVEDRRNCWRGTGDVAAVETAIVKWIVATVLASAALAFTIAKFVH